MRRRQTSFRALLLTACAFPLGVFLAASAYLLTVGMVVTHTVQPPTAPTIQVSEEPEWQGAYSRRFPGCVSLLLWPSGEVPSRLVVVRRSGQPARMGLEELVQRAGTRSSADDVRAIGACR